MASTTSPNRCAGYGIMAGWAHGHNTSHVGARDRLPTFSIIAAATKEKRPYFPMLQPPTCCSRRGTKAREKIGPVLVVVLAAVAAASRLFAFGLLARTWELAGCLGRNVDGRAWMQLLSWSVLGLLPRRVNVAVSDHRPSLAFGSGIWIISIGEISAGGASFLLGVLLLLVVLSALLWRSHTDPTAQQNLARTSGG